MNEYNMYIWLLLLLLFIIIFGHILYNYTINSNNTNYENFEDISLITDTESLQNVAKLYNGERLTVEDLLVTGSVYVKGNANMKNNVNIGDVKFNSANDDEARMTISKDSKNILYVDKNGNMKGAIKLNNPVINGNLTVKGGSRFNGAEGKHTFSDRENAGTLRIGKTNWNDPGIASSGSIVVGSSSKKIIINNTENLDDIIRSRTWAKYCQ